LLTGQTRPRLGQMRIVCQKCSAAYAVDDKLLTPKGVRAQCPRCRTLQLVKKEDNGPQLAPSPFLGGLAPGRGHKPPVPMPVDSGLTGPKALQPNPVVPEAAAPSFAFDFSEPPPLPMQPVGTQNPFEMLTNLKPISVTSLGPGNFEKALSAEPGFASSNERSWQAESGPSEEPGFASSSPSLHLAPAPFVEIQNEARCETCGKRMVDPFDMALGTCDDCRHRVEKATADAPKLAGGEAGRFERLERRSEEAPIPIAQRPRAAPFEDLEQALKNTEATYERSTPSGVQSAQRDMAPKSRWPVWAAVCALLALGGVGLSVWQPWKKKAAPTATKLVTNSQVVDAVVGDFARVHPEMKEASSEEAKRRLADAERLLSKDTEMAYREAARQFQKVIVAQPTNDAAISGWVLAVAFGAGSKIGPTQLAQAEKLLASAEKRGALPRIFVAHAHLRIAAGDLADVKVYADQGKRSPVATDRALSALASGYTMLTKNPERAEAEFREAQVLDPQLKRAAFFFAELAVQQGHYREAITELEKRLAADSEQTKASRELARLYMDVGENAKAKSVLASALKEDKTGARAAIDAAVFGYQHDGQLDESLARLETLAVDAEIDPDDQSEANLHRSHILRVKGQWQEAVASADRVLATSPEDIDALTAKILALLDGGRTSDARLTFDAAKKGFQEINVAIPLEARILMLEKKPLEAFDVLKPLTSENARPLFLLMAGAAAAQARKDGTAWELCLKRVASTDLYMGTPEPMARRYIRAVDLAKEAVGSWDKLRTDRNEDPNPEMCEGLLAWHLQNRAQAEQRFAKVNTIDPQNASAWSYRSLAALERGDVNAAQNFAKRALVASSVSPWAHLAQAKVLMAKKKPDVAKTDADAAAKYMPTLLSARTLTAEVDALHDSKPQALRNLTTVLIVDPTFRPAKRALYNSNL
jgi:cellulose synthase operon protein C